MFALLINLMLYAEGGGFMRFYHDYLDIPGFEAWKFLNLGVFIAVIVYLLKKPMSESYKARRNEIRSELIKAEEEKQAALAQLNSAEAKIALLDTEREQIFNEAREEAAAEKKRLAAQTKADVERMKQQMQSELSRLTLQSRAQLRRFSAQESVRLAEEKLRSQIGNAEDARLVKASINEIGGLN